MNTMYIFMLTLLLSPLLLLSQHREGEEHPIDIKLETCLDIDSNQTTYGMMACIQASEDAWDQLLNALYKELMNSLDSTGQERLRTAQRAWLAYRDAEFTLNGSIYYENLSGTIYYIFAADREMEIVKHRVLELQSYLDALTDFGLGEEEE